MKVLTSVTMHTTSEGQRISYTYSEVNEDTMVIVRDNIRESLIVLPVPANTEVLRHIKAVQDFVSGKLGA